MNKYETVRQLNSVIENLSEASDRYSKYRDYTHVGGIRKINVLVRSANIFREEEFVVALWTTSWRDLTGDYRKLVIHTRHKDEVIRLLEDYENTYKRLLKKRYLYSALKEEKILIDNLERRNRYRNRQERLEYLNKARGLAKSLRPYNRLEDLYKEYKVFKKPSGEYRVITDNMVIKGFVLHRAVYEDHPRKVSDHLDAGCTLVAKSFDSDLVFEEENIPLRIIPVDSSWDNDAVYLYDITPYWYDRKAPEWSTEFSQTTEGMGYYREVTHLEEKTLLYDWNHDVLAECEPGKYEAICHRLLKEPLSD